MGPTNFTSALTDGRSPSTALLKSSRTQRQTVRAAFGRSPSQTSSPTELPTNRNDVHSGGWRGEFVITD